MRPRSIVPRLALAAALLCSLPALAAEQRSFSRSFTLPAGEPLRLANLAGHVDLMPGTGREVKVEATVFAEGRNAAQTSELLSGMSWVEARDRKGRPEWALSYPVERFRGFAYPGVGRGRQSEPGMLERLLSGFGLNGRSNGHYLGSQVAVFGTAGPSVPVLYVDLKISVPAAGGQLVVRNLVGNVDGGELEGDLVVDTGAGDVTLAGFNGKLLVDTGSGDVRLGRVRGETSVDTGSGSVNISELIGNGDLDTGSGDVEVARLAVGKLRADTGSGSIEVRNGTATTLIADTGSGDILVRDVEVEIFEGDTGSGNVRLESSLKSARDVRIDTGSGDVTILAGADASFDLRADQGSGELTCRYADATLRKEGHEVVGAERGDRRTRIFVDTGSGDCLIGPK